MRAQPAVHEIGQGSLNTLIQSLTHSSLLLEQVWSLQQPPGFESQPGVLPTATEPHPRPSDPVGESPKAHSPSVEDTGTFLFSLIDALIILFYLTLLLLLLQGRQDLAGEIKPLHPSQNMPLSSL